MSNGVVFCESCDRAIMTDRDDVKKCQSCDPAAAIKRGVVQIERLETVGHGPQGFMAVMSNDEALGGEFFPFTKGGEEALVVIMGDHQAKVHVRKGGLYSFEVKADLDNGRHTWASYTVTRSQYHRPDKRHVLRLAIEQLYKQLAKGDEA